MTQPTDHGKELTMRMVMVVTIGLASIAAPAAAQHGHGHGHAQSDTTFEKLQQRGRQAMGVDQYTSTHVFEPLEDGGRIELQRDVEDSTGVRVIREHLQEIAKAFAAGDFDTPMFVHDREVPGTKVMAAKRAAIRYEYRPLPRGGEVRLRSADREAIAAIHQFLAFQREDHRVERSGS